MEFTWFEYGAIFIVTFLGELFGSVVGGGGFIIQPFLIALGVPAHIAVANDVSAASGTSAGSAFVFSRRNLIRWPIFRLMLPALVLGGVVGLFVFRVASADFIEKFIALTALGFLAYTVVLRPNLGQAERVLPKQHELKLALFAFLLGCYTTFSGAGAGTFATYLLTVIFGTTFIQALGVQSVVFLVVMPLGFVGYVFLGLIQFKLLAVMLSATLVAGVAGARVAILIGNRWLRPIFLIAVLGFSLYLLSR